MEASRKYLVTILLSACMLNCNAQIFIASNQLEDLYSRLPEEKKNVLAEIGRKNRDSQVDTLVDWDGKKISCLFDKGVLTKLGIHLNGLHHSNKYDSIVIAFLERALLRLSFEKSIPDILSTAESMQVNILYHNNTLLFSPIDNFDELLKSINSSTRFKLAQNDYLFYAGWEKDKNSLFNIIFPNNYQLLVGKNKKELDEEISEKLKKLNIDRSIVESQVVNSTSTDSVPILVSSGSSYMDKLSSELFFKRIGKDSILVFEEDLIPYSVSNLFLKTELAGNRNLQLDQKLYGGRSNSYTLKLHNFISYLEENDFQGFVGHENTDLELIEGTVVFRHTYFNYIHMLHFKSNSTEIFNDSGNITAKFYANIPMHNVRNLVGEFKPGDVEKIYEIVTKDP